MKRIISVAAFAAFMSSAVADAPAMPGNAFAGPVYPIIQQCGGNSATGMHCSAPTYTQPYTRSQVREILTTYYACDLRASRNAGGGLLASDVYTCGGLLYMAFFGADDWAHVLIII